jgi:hypothetical protein
MPLSLSCQLRPILEAGSKKYYNTKFIERAMLILNIIIFRNSYSFNVVFKSGE